MRSERERERQGCFKIFPGVVFFLFYFGLCCVVYFVPCLVSVIKWFKERERERVVGKKGEKKQSERIMCKPGETEWEQLTSVAFLSPAIAGVGTKRRIAHDMALHLLRSAKAKLYTFD